RHTPENLPRPKRHFHARTYLHLAGKPIRDQVIKFLSQRDFQCHSGNHGRSLEECAKCAKPVLPSLQIARLRGTESAMWHAAVLVLCITAGCVTAREAEDADWPLYTLEH